jgi:membrane protein
MNKVKKYLSNFMHAKDLFSKTGFLLKESFREFITDNGMKLSAALSYYTIFSLPPLLLIIISICGFFFGADAVRGEIFGQINGLVGNNAALQIQEVLKNVKLSTSNYFATIIGVIILVVGASGVFSEIQDSLNFIWRIKTKPKRSIAKFLYNRLMSFSMIASVGFLLLVGLIINAAMDFLYKSLAANFNPGTFFFIYLVNLVIVFIIITLLFTIIFRTLPDGKVVLKDCFIGASFTAFLFMLGKFAIGAYLGSSTIGSTYGAAGSIILVLAWVYYSAIILYFGAEFTKIYAHTHGMKITPNTYSLKVKGYNY